MLSDILNSLLQVIVFALIPSLVYLIWFRQQSSYFEFLGIKRANFKANALAAIASLLFLVPPLVLVAVDPQFKSILADPETITGKFAALGWYWTTVISILFIAVIKTSFAEELFFRGFIAKRLIA